MSLLPNFPGLQDLNLSENSNVSDPLITSSHSHSLSRSDLPLPDDIFGLRMYQQKLQFEKEREETKMKLLHQIQENQVTNYFHLNSRLGDVQLGQNRTERQISELRHEVTEIKMGMQALLNQNTTHSPALSPRSDIGSPPHKPGGTTTVHCEVTTECCNTKVTIPLDYIPGRSRYEDKYLCSICKKSLGKNYYQKHVQAVCLRKRGCPNCQP